MCYYISINEPPNWVAPINKGGVSMNFINLLASAGSTSGVDEVVTTAYDTFKAVVNIVMPVIIAVVLMFGIIYGIILGIKFAKAEDTEARDKAKQQLINMLIGVLVAAVIAAVVYAILGSGAIKKLFPDVSDNLS